MLVFLDESYERYERDRAAFQRHAYAGFGIQEAGFRRLSAAVHQCKLKFVVDGSRMSEPERVEAAKTKLVFQQPVEDFELKSTKLLGNRQLRRLKDDGFSPGLSMAAELLDAAAAVGITVFGTLQPALDPIAERLGDGPLPRRLHWLLERVNQWVVEQHPDSLAVIIPDKLDDSSDRRAGKQVADFLFRSAAGRRLRKVVPSPFYVDSQTNAGSQIADLIAHILMNTMRPIAEQKDLTLLQDRVSALEFRSADLQMRGIRRIRK